MTSAVPSECILVQASRTCAPWNGYYFNQTAFTDFAGRPIDSVSAFDDYIKSNTFSTSQQSLLYFRERFQCPNWSGEGLRYMVSYNCVWAIYALSSPCNTAKPQKGLCSGTWATLKRSMVQVLNDETQCSKTDVQSQNTRANEYQSFMTLGDQVNTNNNNNQCVAGNDDEARSCGFGSSYIEKALEYCRSMATPEPCCANVPGFSTTIAVKEDNSGTLGLILGLVFGFIALLLVGGAFYYYLRRSQVKKKANNGQTREMVENGRNDFTDLNRLDTEVTLLEDQQNGVNARTASKAKNNGTGNLYSEASCLSLTASAFHAKHRAIMNYYPIRDDEMIVRIGDEIVLTSMFSDGWAMGYNETSGVTGALPLCSLDFDGTETERMSLMKEKLSVKTANSTDENMKLAMKALNMLNTNGDVDMEGYVVNTRGHVLNMEGKSVDNEPFANEIRRKSLDLSRRSSRRSIVP